MAIVAMGILVAGMAGAQATKTTQLSGTVVEVEGNTLLVKMSSGEVQMFTPPPDRKFVIDGKELTLSQLQPGTTLNATVTETSTPGTQKTVETLSGTVWLASGPTVILRLPSGENKRYFIGKDHPAKFYDAQGKEISVFDLKKNMNIKATKITEAPTVELATNVAVTGTAPTALAQAQPAAPKPAAAEQAARPAAAPPAPKPAAAEPAARPAAPASSAAAQPASTETGQSGLPKKLPTTGRSLPLIALLGLVLVGAGLVVRGYRSS
jgi:LPXTG-motif cell wall-anchored protein